MNLPPPHPAGPPAVAGPSETPLQSALRRVALEAQWLQVAPAELARLLADEMGRRAPNDHKEVKP